MENFKEIQENNLLSFCTTIENLIIERNRLRQENENLKKEVEKFQKHSQELFNNSCKIQDKWVGAMLDGSLKAPHNESQ